MKPEDRRYRPLPALRHEQQSRHLAVHAVVEGDLLERVTRADLPRDDPRSGRRGPRRQVAKRIDDGLEDRRPLILPGDGACRNAKLADIEPPVSLGDERVPPGGGLAVIGGGLRPGGRDWQGPVAADGQLPQHAIGDRLGEPLGARGRVMRPVGAEHRLRASLLDDPVQVVDGHAELTHDRSRRGVVSPHVGLRPIKIRPSLRMSQVDNRSRVGEDQRGIASFADAGDDLAGGFPCIGRVRPDGVRRSWLA